MESEIQKRIQRNGLIISRIPGWAKDAFIARSNEEFASDYGLCLASMCKECDEYSRLKEMFFTGNLISSLPETKEEGKKIILANGKKLNTNGGQNE